MRKCTMTGVISKKFYLVFFFLFVCVLEGCISKVQLDLHLPALQGNLSVIQKSLQKGYHVDTRDQFGRTPLMLAALKNNIKVVEYLVEQGADVNALMTETSMNKWIIINPKEPTSPLMCASFAGEIDILNYLLEKGADPNITSKAGATPLSLAKDQHHLLIISRLQSID